MTGYSQDHGCSLRNVCWYSLIHKRSHR